jgi:eukaryotic-like serine/threonine-protein kinase
VSPIGHYRKAWLGGMGIVYKAEDLRLHRYIALKFLPEDASINSHAVEGFRQEA